MKRVKVFGFIILGIFVLILAFTFLGKESGDEVKFVKVERKYFEVSVEGKGDIIAAKSINIYPPELFFDRSLRIHQIKVDNLVKEGTEVKKGDFIAELDHTEIEQKIQQYEEQITRLQERLDVALLDSSVDLSGVRVDIQKIKDNLQDAQIRVEQSVYESPAVQRQLLIARNRVQRQLENAKRNYERRVVHEKNQIASITKKLRDYTRLNDKYKTFNSQLKIYAPEDGIVIYAKSYRGKVKSGDMISPYWGSVVATLPDLNNLDSEVYINEIEITKIDVGKEVRVQVDAIKEKEFLGEVKEISRIGKKSTEDDFKVYRVLVRILDPGNQLKPAMSTINSFVIDTIPEALTIPLNTVFGEENHNFVYKKSGINIVKKEIQIGVQNKLEVVVLNGLKEGDKILAREPEGAEKLKIVYLHDPEGEEDTSMN